ncbi:MAG TPA: helix-turn-helix domain-containing protein [Terriglobia bacterium]|nr:helix-turn-helix domain-containing protein [Terriglobia bacterium]
MRRTWTQIKNETMTKGEQRQAHMLATRALADMELSELREALEVSQGELAKKLRVTQAAISRLERRPNLLVESIANYVEALGGRLELHAVLPNRTVKLTHLFANEERKKSGPAIRRKHREDAAITR